MTQTAELIPEEQTDEDIFAEEAERRQKGVPELVAPAEPDPAAAAPATEVTPTPQVVEEQKPAWYAELSDEAKVAFDAAQAREAELQTQYTALHGRLAPMQQANERLRQKVEQAGQPPQPAPNSSATSSQQPGQTAPATTPTPQLDLADVPEFAEFREAFPEEAKAIAALFGRQAQHVGNLQEQLGNVSEGLEQIQQASFGRERESELEKLSGTHPDWMQIRPSEDFGKWLQTQPQSVAQMADSQVAAECIYVIDRYKQDVYLQGQLDNPADPATPPAPRPAQTVRKHRQQIRSAPSLQPQGGGVGTPLASPDAAQSEEDIWAEEVERRLRVQRDARLNQ